MNIQDLIKVDFKKLPDEILNAIYTEAHQEVSNRRRFKLDKNKKKQMLLCRKLRIKDKHRLAEFDSFMANDWSGVYPESGGKSDYYVYAHVEPLSSGFSVSGHNLGGIPFYIGKGTGERAYDFKRNEGHGVKLRYLLDLGKSKDKIVYIFASGLTESKAFEIEAKLIYFFGTQFTSNKGCLLNLIMPKTPFD